MTATIVCNITLNLCGIVILLLLLPSGFLMGFKRRINRKKQQFLLYAVITHFFSLCTRLAECICLIQQPDLSVSQTFQITSDILLFASVIPVLLCILTDENGMIRLPRGKNIPILHILFLLIPPLFGIVLAAIFTNITFRGISWAISLNLLQNLIWFDNEKKLEESEQKLELNRGAVMTVRMQPHFIFNALSSIEALCQTDPKAASESIKNLSGYLRANIDALASESLIPFDEEFKHIKQYVSLEKNDPSRQFQFDYELDVRDFLLPSLTVQPIIENAIKHGALTHTDGSGRVLLETEERGEYIRITVSDNGGGIDALTKEQHKSRGIGINATRKRLETLCHGSLQISGDENGTKAVILIPRYGNDVEYSNEPERR